MGRDCCLPSICFPGGTAGSEPPHQAQHYGLGKLEPSPKMPSRQCPSFGRGGQAARVQPPPEASLKGVGEPGGRIRGRRRGGVPPLNSLKCVGERGKDQSFSSQHRDPAKGARKREISLRTLSACCELGGSSKAVQELPQPRAGQAGVVSPSWVTRATALPALPAWLRGRGEGREPCAGC